MNGEQKKRSALFYVGIGCGALTILCVIVFGLGAIFAVGKFKEIKEEMTDPVKREARILELLGAESLPEGYYPLIAMKIPLLVQIVGLTDQPAKESGEPREPSQRGFMYFKVMGSIDDEMRAYFSGETDDPAVFKRHNISLDLDSKEIIGRGVIESDDQTLLYVSHLGSVRTDHGKSKGIQTTILVDCPNDEKMRIGLWFGPDPAIDDAGNLDYTGTTADRDAIADFMHHFSLCGAN